METGQELDILNFHKSFPITCKGRVESIDHNKVILKVQPPGSVCLESQEQTIVLSRGLPEAVRAHIISFDLLTGTLHLSDFGYVGSHFGDRMIARVQPGEQIDVTIQNGEQRVSGILADVSLSGVGVFVQDNIFQKGQLLELGLPLPEGTVNLPGKVLNVSEAPDGQTRLAISFTRNAQEISTVMRYIKDRRTEILSEIEYMYEHSYQTGLSSSKGQES
jgi:hypothetical protein